MSTGYPSNLSDAEWECLQRYLPPQPKRGRPSTHSLRSIFNAIFSVLRTGCPWRYLPVNSRYQQVVEFRRQGVATQEIAERVGLSDRTVRDWLKRGTFPEAQKRRKKQSSFDPFTASVLKRWQDGEHNGLLLWQEIKKQGYTGTDSSVYRYLKTLKQAEVRASLSLFCRKEGLFC